MSGQGESRSYVVGLPVLITVWDDGTVIYDIDTAEAAEAVSDGWYETEPDGPDDVPYEVMQADVERIGTDHDRRNAL